MKQVDRKFLQEQVKIALRESNLPKEEKQLINEILGINAAIWYVFKDEPWFQMIMDFVIALLVGSKESWKTVYDFSKRTLVYGGGLAGIYAKVQREEKLDKVQSIALRLLDPKLTSGGKLTAEFRAEPFDDFYNIIDSNAPKIANAKSSKQIYKALNQFYKESDTVVKKHVLSNEQDGTFVDKLLYWKNPIAKGWIELFTGDVSRKHYNTGHNNKQWLTQETKATKKMAGNVEEIKERLEGGILMTLGIGTFIKNFSGFYTYLKSDEQGKKLIGVLAAAAAAKYHDEQPVFLAFADILLSIIGTIAMIFTLGGSKAALGPAQAGIKAATMTSTASKMSTAAKALNTAKVSTIFASKTYMITEIGFTFAQMLDQVTETLGPQVAKYNNYSSVYFDIYKNNRYLKSAGNPLDDDWDFDDAAILVYKGIVGEATDPEKQQNPEEFITLDPTKAKQVAKAIRIKKMEPLLESITTAFYSEHGKAMSKLKMQVPKLQNTDWQKKRILKALESGDQETHDKYIEDIMQFQKELEEYAKTMNSRTKKAKELGKQAQVAAKITDSANEPALIQLPKSVIDRSPGFAAETEPQEKPEDPSVEPGTVNSADLFFVGDSIAQAMRNTAKGADGVTHGGRTSDYVLKQLRSKFGEAATLEEESGNKTAVVSVGTNDAVNHSVGNKRYTPEKTARNIEQIVNLLKQNGYNTVKVMPLMQDGKKDRKHYTYNNKKLPFSKEAHVNYVNSVNSSLQSSGLELFDNNVELWPDGIHPKSPKSLLSKALGAKISQPPSSSVVASQGTGLDKDKDKPREEFDGDVDKINTFFDRPVKEMKTISRSKREAAVRKYYQIIGAESKTGLPLEVLVKHIGAESGYLNREFLGDTKIKSGPSYGLGQILRTTGQWLSGQPGHPKIPAGQTQVDFLNVASNNLDMTIKQLQWNRRYLSKKEWFKKSDPTQKNLFLLYSYNMGPGGPGRYIKRAGGDIELALSNLSDHYVKRYNFPMGYGHKIMAAAGKSVPTEDFDDVDVKPSSSATSISPSGTAAESEEKPLSEYLSEIKEIDNFEDFSMYFSQLFRVSASDVQSRKSKMKTVSADLDGGNLSTYAKDSAEYLKLRNKSVGSRWSRQFKAEMAAAKGDKTKEELARKKIAYQHRPVFFGELFTISIPNIDGSHVSLAFEPGTKRISTFFGKTKTFYKQDHQGNSNFNKLLAKLKDLSAISAALVSKIQELSAKEEKKETLNNYLSFTSDFSKIVSGVVKILADDGEAAVRKAYATYILNRAFTSVT